MCLCARAWDEIRRASVFVCVFIWLAKRMFCMGKSQQHTFPQVGFFGPTRRTSKPRPESSPSPFGFFPQTGVRLYGWRKRSSGHSQWSPFDFVFVTEQTTADESELHVIEFIYI